MGYLRSSATEPSQILSVTDNVGVISSREGWQGPMGSALNAGRKEPRAYNALKPRTPHARRFSAELPRTSVSLFFFFF